MASRPAPTFPVAACLVLLLAAPAAAAEDRRHWDWGQHHTSLAGEPARPLAEPTPPGHWDDHGAPVRFVRPTVP